MQNHNFDQLVLYLNQFDEKCLCSVDITTLVFGKSKLRDIVEISSETLEKMCVITEVFFFSGEKNLELYLSKKKTPLLPI